VVLIGDEKQLGVFSKFRQLDGSNLKLSLFERLIEVGKVPRIMLDTQYRMHPTICEPLSTVIYGGLLKTGPGVAGE
jgi:superfamily I DNA and/or RNA helicase